MVAFFSHLFGKQQEKHILGIDIGVSAIKVVELERKDNRAALKTYGSIALGPYANQTVGTATQLSVEKTVEALTDVLREAKTTTKKAGVAIPFSSSLISTIEMPNVSDKQLGDMIPIEARKYIPIPISEVKLDWSVIPPEDGVSSDNLQTKEILLVAIHNEALTKEQTIIEQATVMPQFFEIEIFSSLRSVTDGVKGPVLIIDFGASSTKLYVIERGILRLTHKINRGGQNLTQAIARIEKTSLENAEVLKREVGLEQKNQETKEALLFIIEHTVSEIHGILSNYQQKTGKSVGTAILLGGGAVLRGLEQHIRNMLQQKVVRGNPFSHVTAPAFLSNTLYEIGPEFAVALGLAERGLQGGE